MHKTPIIMVKNHLGKLYVSKYMIRRTNGGQLVLDLIKYMGNLHTLNRLNTEEAYFAIEDVNYYSEENDAIVKSFLGKDFEKIEQKETVVVTLNDKDCMKYRPYRIRIFCNNVRLQKFTDCEDEKFTIKNNELWLEFKKGDQTTRFKFYKSTRSITPDLSNLYLERNTHDANISNVYWIDKSNCYRKSHVTIFSVKWAKEMLSELDKIKEEKRSIYPTAEGIWIKEKTSCMYKVLPVDAYKSFTQNKHYGKSFWVKYFENFQEDIHVVFNDRFPNGKIITEE